MLFLCSPRDEEDDSDLSDHEEEFYYTEIEVSVDTVTETFADMHTSSPPSITFDMQPAIPDHDYQKKMPVSRWASFWSTLVQVMAWHL